MEESVDFGSDVENGFAGVDDISGGRLFATGGETFGVGFDGEISVGVGSSGFAGTGGALLLLASSSCDTDVAATILPTDKAKSELAATPNETF